MFSDSSVIRKSSEKELPVAVSPAQKDAEQDGLSFDARGVFKGGDYGFQGESLNQIWFEFLHKFIHLILLPPNPVLFSDKDQHRNDLQDTACCMLRYY